MTSCAVVICVYTEDRWDEILESVESVRAQDPPPHELIVVVDHNPALQARLIERLPDVRGGAQQPRTGAIRRQEHRCRLTTGTWWYSSTTTPRPTPAGWPGWLGTTRTPTCSASEAASIRAGPRNVRLGWPPEFDWVIGCSYVGQKPGVVRNVIGANASFRRKLFAEGGFASDIGRTALISRRSGVRRPNSASAPTRPTRTGCSSSTTPPRSPTTFRPHGRAFLLPDPLLFRGAVQGSGDPTRRRGSRLSSERTYTRVALPTGVARGIGDTFRGQAAGLLRAAAIVIGLGYTTFGYLVGTASGRLGALRGGTR